jgi:hypothetical protein
VSDVLRHDEFALRGQLVVIVHAQEPAVHMLVPRPNQRMSALEAAEAGLHESVHSCSTGRGQRGRAGLVPGLILCEDLLRYVHFLPTDRTQRLKLFHVCPQRSINRNPQ